MKIANNFGRLHCGEWLATVVVVVVMTVALMGVPGHVQAFNLSPKPNVIIKDPQFNTVMPKVESSYFGYTLNLRPSGVIVGAPRAQSTLPLQQNINETGAIYRCSIVDSTCFVYVLEDSGNIAGSQNEYTYDSEIRDHQWLGAAMDGGTMDTDKLLVCAPRFRSSAPSDYLLHGICYWINDTLTKMPTEVKKVSPLRLKDKQQQSENGQRIFYYMLAEQGLSAHVSENNEEFLIGAPGIHTWKGSVIRYFKKYNDDSPILSRRDLRSDRITRQSDVGPTFTYESEVPNPKNWDQSDDSYFGYSVGSGYFDSENRQKLLYVATAPQANNQSGEAYIFDISGGTIQKKFVFRGSRFGEYFGYAVLAEDLNGDGLTDVVISAPQYSISGSFDDGAIYVYINKGRFNFEQKLLTSPFHGKARFGTSLNKLGDINRDGFNDIAVGAPFAGNGSVFVYLGSEKGLRDQPSQRLNSPASRLQTKYGGHMFGHGLSKGSDIDGNGFNDFAIGAPNAEAVFVYRAYPVVKIDATIRSDSREIKIDQRSFKVTACYAISTKSSKVKSQDIALRLVVDPQVKRVKFSQNQKNEMSFNVSAGIATQCRVFDCDVRYSVEDVFKPIELEIHHELIKGIPDSEVFCDDCAAVDPTDPKVFTEKIIFNTGCASDVCVADLEIKSSGLDHSVVLGSSRTLTINYAISNRGETAYLPQINVTSSNRLPFARIPSNCKVNKDVMVCDLNQGQPMTKGGRDSLRVDFDVSGLSGKHMVVTAEVFSTGREMTPRDNVLKDAITLKKFTQVDATGYPKTGDISLEKVSGIAEVRNFYEILSHGPSNVDVLEVAFTIPLAYKIGAHISIIDIQNITMQATNDGQLIKTDFYQNNSLIIMNAYEHTTTTTTTADGKKAPSDNGNHYDSTKMGHMNEINGGVDLSNTNGLSEVMVASTMSRRRRRRDLTMKTATKDHYARIGQLRTNVELDDEQKAKLPINRTIVFNCNDPATTECLRAVLRVYDFKPDKPIIVNMKYTVDLREVQEILVDPWDVFVIRIDVNVTNVNNADSSSMVVNRKIQYNIISKISLGGSVPIWIIILAVIGGILLMAIISYGLYKSGFFKRSQMEEMNKLVNEQKTAGEGTEEEAEHLNPESN